MKNKRNKRQLTNYNKGITLIVLVITIIVLLILAGVVISTLTGNNGLLQKATDAKISTTEAEGLENIQLAVMASQDKDGINTTSLAKNLSKINGLTDTNNQAITENTEITLPKSIKLNNVKYNIKEDGTIKKSLLPAEYQQVEYIESTGTQYIDTGIIPDTTLDKMEVDMAITKNKTDFTNIIGYGADDGGFYVGVRNGIYIFGTSNDYTSTGSYTLNTKIKFELDAKNKQFKCYDINGQIVSQKNNFNVRALTQNITLALFAWRNSNGIIPRQGYFKIYSYKYYNNDELVQDLIPCLDRNGTPCMYDTISRQIFYNSGTGTFGYETEDGTYVAPSPTNN